MSNKLQKAALAGVVALIIGVFGRFGYKLISEHNHATPLAYNNTPAALKSTPSGSAMGGITVTVLNPTPAPSCPDHLEAVLTQAQDYVTQHSWKEILRQYAGVQDGVIVSIRDYQGNDREQACRLALGRLVETTIGSVADRAHPKYQELADAVVAKGLDDCRKDIKLSGCRNYDLRGRVTKDTRCYEVRFGL